MKNTETILTKKQIMLSRIIIGAVLLILGVFLLLAGTGVFPFSFNKSVLPACLTAVGAILFILGFVQENTFSLWLAFPFLVAALVTILALSTPMGYAKLYPIYIFAPALASVVTAIYDKAWQTHLKVIIPFTVIAALFALNSFFCVPWKIILPSFLILLGIAAAGYGIRK